ncbi:DUF305 domain-containing protein [Mumia zhuanghuii]|uniref:DUF305 domain-containing protein n=2 Tax=Mumia TaxID=1546255 RepID=A0ABW1QJ80_9ACTN|nr:MULTISPECIES: DUF305 domain-containing protein [Mumia]KAA1423645.1 DUF305 domain-containing protein [Mumia zhuanghuii]
MITASSFNHTARRRAAALVTAVAFGLGVSACGADDSGSGSAGGGHDGHGASQSSDQTQSPDAAGDHNAADVTFAQQMIPHHRQALEMAALAPTRAGAEVEDLAARIAAAQDPEIATMTGWLEEWGEEVPADDAHADHGDMEGMMSPEDLERLEGLSGASFDEEFLRQMIVHHEGAVTMAKNQIADGANPEAVALAEAVVDAQQSEIDEMAALLG